jgi:hypothetical protein
VSPKGEDDPLKNAGRLFFDILAGVTVLAVTGVGGATISNSIALHEIRVRMSHCEADTATPDWLKEDLGEVKKSVDTLLEKVHGLELDLRGLK